MKTSARLTALLLAAALLLASCGGGASATTMRLRKTEGTVGVSDGEGKDIAPREDLGLYSGYQVDTQAESYAWIDLDSVKLTKLDAGSEVEIAKEGKNLEINVKSGNLFFNVAEPLAEDESMFIRTSTMAIGIRGTCGWVTENTAALLEGTVSVTAGDQEVTVSAGEMVVLTGEGTLEVKDFTPNDVPAFVREEIADDEDLAAVIQDTTGMDLTGSLESAYPDVFQLIAHLGGEVIFTEEIDFEQDGSPELLVLYRGEDVSGVQASIHRKGIEHSENLGGFAISEVPYVSSRFSLASSEGRLYLMGYEYSGGENAEGESYRYVGTHGQNDSDSTYWGLVDNISYSRIQDQIQYSSHEHDEKGLTREFVDSTAGEYEAVVQKYTEERVIWSNG